MFQSPSSDQSCLNAKTPKTKISNKTNLKMELDETGSETLPPKQKRGRSHKKYNKGAKFITIVD